ncbi:hypothetical protein GS3922_16330 [Geobacillus subterraneus]|uniref:DUF2529 domain-containing protein n=2 Tax=Geobacillus TaxID=129337 RepID=A0ABN4NK29_9BACL|nr:MULTISPECIES: DUF2529 domain-containing protein [Geobacillus]AMX85049.1 hypothetical protein GS3922_16330 [Geobacillus subterraneus]KZS25784.1 hypothetical protein A5418_11475 [Geobacillus subterraneus]OXB85247.1 hypothetical protein B9L21_16440 [Geobacillus uzenensis]QIZ66118.1 DUF2529 domain-containing protein [Geobacillus subterraneus]WPZ18319.1 DUF2529 domain-containing protein [Geobacillus subterraneus]
MKILTTQTIGLLQKIAADEELALEDGARLLAQAAISNGRIWLYGTGELDAVVAAALLGPDSLPKAAHLEPEAADDWNETDRALVFARFSNDKEAIRLVEQLQANGVDTVAVSTLVKDEPGLADIAAVHIDSKLSRPLVPTEDGRRIAMPTVVAASFIYYGLLVLLDEILEEYQ